MGCGINAKISDLDHSFSIGFGGDTSKVCANSSQEFIHAERFGHVVVRAGIERFDFLLLFVANGQDNNRHLGNGAHVTTELNPIDSRHREIGNDQVRLPVFHDFQRHLARIGDAYVVSLRRQTGAENARDLRLVIHDEDVG